MNIPRWLRVSIAVKRDHSHSNSYKGKHLIGAGLQFGGLVHYCHGKKHGGREADTVLKKELIYILICRQQKEAVPLGLV